MNTVVRLGLAGCLALVAMPLGAEEKVDTSNIMVKQAIADTMTPEQLQAYKERLARNLAARRRARIARRAVPPGPDTPSDTCPAATLENGPLPYGPTAGTTVGDTDTYDLPADVTNPTCFASTNCTGAGPAGSLPRGAIYTGTGVGPDRAYHIKTDANCNLTINMDPTADDLALIVYQTTCSSLLSDCVCVSDTGLPGDLETVTLNAVANTDYFVVVDGYSTNAVPPGPAGPFTLSIALAGGSPVCNLVSGGGPSADLSVTKTDGQSSYIPGQVLTYTIVVTNNGAITVNGVVVTDTFPADLGSITWTCAASAGSACGSANGAGNINTTANLLALGSATYTVTATASLTAAGNISNTATVAPPAGVTDPVPGNNSATDTDTRVGGAYHTITPCRLADTRNPAGPYGGPALTAGVDRTFDVDGGACAVPANATAVFLNVTVAGPTADGNIRLWPTGTAFPTVSALNYSAGQTRGNNGIFKLNAGAQLDIRATQGSGTTDVILDVVGYFVE